MVPRHLRMEVPGRLSYDGKVLKPLNLKVLPKMVEAMRREGIAPGDVVVLTSGKLERSSEGLRNPDPIDREFVVAGAYRTHHTGYDGSNTLIRLDVLQQMLQKPADTAHEIVVRVHNRAATEATAERLTRTVRRVLGYETKSELRGPIARSWRERNRNLLQSIEWQRELMKIILIVIMVTASVLMYATLSMMVTEKTSDIGILTAKLAKKASHSQVCIWGGKFGLSSSATMSVVPVNQYMLMIASSISTEPMKV